ncbi:hypothetical protein [Lactobacillus sp. LL6]|uniref:hypothetical protein n=1 Tax=Lactobacillus sp. LL6 TaxID=2596827 RepID=UPI001186D8CD|nr:hypothetical protein [Lactobacillus sp. LL6]TSO26884.1 hypothetical protein FOD82_07640 [Lactobacillus sp. LL6]
MKLKQQEIKEYSWINSLGILIWTFGYCASQGLQKLNSEIGICLLILMVLPIFLSIMITINSKIRKYVANNTSKEMWTLYWFYVVIICLNYRHDFRLINIVITVIAMILEILLFHSLKDAKSVQK